LHYRNTVYRDKQPRIFLGKFPLNILPIPLSTEEKQPLEITITTENNRFLEVMAQNSGVTIDDVIRSSFHLYKMIDKARQQGRTLGITKSDEILERIELNIGSQSNPTSVENQESNKGFAVMEGF
jgi:hypothetical protein